MRTGVGSIPPLFFEMRVVAGNKPQGLAYPLTKVKEFLRVTGTDQDGVISRLINAAVDIIEQETWIVLGSRSYTLYMDHWYGDTTSVEKYSDHFIIPKYPVTAVDSIKYYDTNNSLQTLATSNYDTSLNGNISRVEVTTQPNVYDKYDAIEVAFTAGYADYFDIPDQFVELLELVIGDLYEQRMTGTMANVKQYGGMVSRLMDNVTKRVFT